VLERMMEELLTASLPPLENECYSALVVQFNSDALATTMGALSSRASGAQVHDIRAV
jgi:hypothetical protein